MNINAQYQSVSTQFQSNHSNKIISQQTSTFEVNISVDQAPLELAYQAARNRINDAVAPYLGDDAIASGHEAGVDVTPEATAGRILNFATGLFGLFQRQHNEEELEQVVNQFLDVIKSGVEQGFAEAKEILSGLSVLEGEIETNIDLTFDLVIEGLDSFALKLLEPEA